MWLDWGSQGAQVNGNLFHDNRWDLTLEVSHGPSVVANNLFLSKSPAAISSQGIAFAHNLIVGGMRYDTSRRRTFYYRPHDSVLLGKHDNPPGDTRWLNNIIGGSISSRSNPPPLPVVFAGNVYIGGTSPSGAGATEPWLMNIEWFKPRGGEAVRATASTAKNGTQVDNCSEGGQSVGRIRSGDRLRFDNLHFDATTSDVEVRAAADNGYGGVIELHADAPDGPSLGSCEISGTGGWQNWRTFTVPIKSADGVKSVCLVFLPAATRGKRGDVLADSAMVLPEVPGPVLKEKPDGWYLTSTQSDAWRTASARALVTSGMLGKAVIPDCGFENVDGSSLEIDTDYLGRTRDPHHPFPGPFELAQSGRQTIKVWPKPMPR